MKCCSEAPGSPTGMPVQFMRHDEAAETVFSRRLLVRSATSRLSALPQEGQCTSCDSTRLLMASRYRTRAVLMLEDLLARLTPEVPAMG